MMDKERMAEIAAMLDAITPGPWLWNQRAYNELPRCDGSKKRRKNELYVYLLQGRPTYPTYHGQLDPYDNTIMYLSWGSIRGSALACATPNQENADFIAAAPAIVRELLAEIDRLSCSEKVRHEDD